MKRLRRPMATRSASNSASASGLSTCLVRGTLCCWSSPKPLPALLPSLSTLATVARDGFPRETERLKDAWAQNDEARAMRAVTDEMVLALSATGTPDDIALRLDALLQAGLKQAVLFPISADGDAKSAILRTVEFLS